VRSLGGTAEYLGVKEKIVCSNDGVARQVEKSRLEKGAHSDDGGEGMGDRKSSLEQKLWEREALEGRLQKKRGSESDGGAEKKGIKIEEYKSQKKNWGRQGSLPKGNRERKGRQMLRPVFNSAVRFCGIEEVLGELG